MAQTYVSIITVIYIYLMYLCTMLVVIKQNIHTWLTVYYKFGKAITSLSICVSCLVFADVVCKYAVYVPCTYFQLKVMKIVNV